MSVPNRYTQEYRPRGNSLQQLDRPRGNSLQQGDSRAVRDAVSGRKRPVGREETYSFALRAAYLAYLLQPRQKRLQPGPPSTAPRPVQISSAMDLISDFGGVRNGRSNKFPHGFMDALQNRVQGVMMGTERLPEFSDPAIRRTMSLFMNDFLEPTKRRSLERDRNMEELLLLFYKNSVKQLQSVKSDDDAWKLMGDRYLAMFIRLMSEVMKDNDWDRDRQELATRLQTLERKLLMHENDLTTSSLNGAAGGRMVEVEVPLTHDVKDMPLVLTVGRIFGFPNNQLQDDIDKHRGEWTEEAAVKDLKTYQQCISLNTRTTLTSDDFDTAEAYEAWKKHELHEIPQLLIAVIQINPELAKTSNGNALAHIQGAASSSDYHFAEISRKMHETSETGSFDHSIDFAALSIGNHTAPEGAEIPFVYIPPNQRSYYRFFVKEAILSDIRDQDTSEATSGLISKKTSDLLHELATRWRVPSFSRKILFLDAVKDLYQNRDISLDTVDKGLVYFKETTPDKRKLNRKSVGLQDLISDWTKWTVDDVKIYQSSLRSIYENVLRDLFQVMQGAYDGKSPSFGNCLYILQEHLAPDPANPIHPKLQSKKFSSELSAALRERAAETYKAVLEKSIPKAEEEWKFNHVIELGKDVVTLCDKIRKRYRKSPEILGANPLMILVEEMLPSFAEDARELVSRIMANEKTKGQDIPVEDGFDLYRELVEIRSVHGNVLPKTPFSFHIEDLLQEFVWRWIRVTEESLVGWVENAVKQDKFQMMMAPGLHQEEQRHSVSVFDVFRSFKESKDQIAELKWDEPYQQAKFMTAIAKAMGMGIAKYCEMIDQMFTKEMDRLTPEQEAALTQSQQEKWITMARNAIAGKEKVEPFQFYPESLVKLNNIEYAMQSLDKIEQEIEVDKMAEIVQKRDEQSKRAGNAPKRPRNENFVFTVKIIEAEDLMACDINGFSDPYVVLGDVQRRLHKTRIVYRNLNPRWDETVDIVTQGPLNVTATVWDWDALGEHDCVGRTSLKLDPSHFRDYMPREYWLDLDTQGRLLLRVSMEGERDDIQFHFGKAFRTLKRTERDMTRSITDKLSAYIRYILSRERLRGLLSRGISGSVSSALSYFNRNRSATLGAAPITEADIANAITPLFEYFDENFAIMKQTLTDSAMIMVMSRLWKQVLVTIEGLLVPPLSDKLSQQKPLTRQELDIVFKWQQLLFDFFHAVDEESGVAIGVPLDILKSPKYHEIVQLNFFYFESTEDLIRTSERMAEDASTRRDEQAARLNRMSAPASSLAPPTAAGHAFGGALMGVSVRRRKTVMLSRNLGTMRKAKEEKRRAAQAEPTDEYILRILRMRPEAERYLRARALQKQRLAAAQAAEAIVLQSMMSGTGGRMVSGLPVTGKGR